MRTTLYCLFELFSRFLVDFSSFCSPCIAATQSPIMLTSKTVSVLPSGTWLALIKVMKALDISIVVCPLRQTGTTLLWLSDWPRSQKSVKPKEQCGRFGCKTVVCNNPLKPFNTQKKFALLYKWAGMGEKPRFRRKITSSNWLLKPISAEH